MKLLMQYVWAGAALSLSISSAAHPNDDGAACREQKLNGLYVFSATGYTIVNGITQPKAIVELIRFNGDGSLSVPGATRSTNGVINTGTSWRNGNLHAWCRLPGQSCFQRRWSDV